MKQQTHHMLDSRVTIIPLTLLKASQAFREMKTGETIEILVSDPDAKEDLLKVLSAYHCELIKTEEEESFYRIVLKRGR